MQKHLLIKTLETQCSIIKMKILDLSLSKRVRLYPKQTELERVY